MRRADPFAGEHPAYDPGQCGPAGLPQCRRCLAEFPRSRGEFCSAACAHEFQLRSKPSYARNAVFQRDAGVCTHCQIDCAWLDRIIAAMRTASPVSDEREVIDPSVGDEVALWLIEILGFGKRRRIVSLWQADHRHAVVEGGGACGLGNLRTLCLTCHRQQTRLLHQRLTSARKPWAAAGDEPAEAFSGPEPYAERPTTPRR